MITFADADGWVGIYVDNSLVYQGHSIIPVMLLDLLQIPYNKRGWYEEDQMEELGGRFPENLDSLPDPV